MALTNADKEFIAQVVAQAITAALPAVSAPKATSTASEPSRFVTEVLRGQHPCTADGGCGRILRTAKRAAAHGVDGHYDARKGK